MPRRQLAAAEVHRSAGQWTTALGLLDEGLLTCQAHNLRLGEVDLHLAYARVYDETGNDDLARNCRAKATRLISATGYGVRRVTAGS